MVHHHTQVLALPDPTDRAGRPASRENRSVSNTEGCPAGPSSAVPDPSRCRRSAAAAASELPSSWRSVAHHHVVPDLHPAVVGGRKCRSGGPSRSSRRSPSPGRTVRPVRCDHQLSLGGLLDRHAQGLPHPLRESCPAVDLPVAAEHGHVQQASGRSRTRRSAARIPSAAIGGRRSRRATSAEHPEHGQVGVDRRPRRGRWCAGSAAG